MSPPDNVYPGLLSTKRDGPVAAFPESYIESGYEQHCFGTPNSGRSYARRAHASRSCARSWMSPSVGSILGEQGQQPTDQPRAPTAADSKPSAGTCHDARVRARHDQLTNAAAFRRVRFFAREIPPTPYLWP